MVSVDILNNGPGGLVVVVPITTASYGLRSHVELASEGSGLDHTSYARCDQLRVVSVERLSSRQGIVGPDQMRTIDGAALCARSVMLSYPFVVSLGGAVDQLNERETEELDHRTRVGSGLSCHPRTWRMPTSFGFFRAELSGSR